jgi:hypothetical protein
MTSGDTYQHGGDRLAYRYLDRVITAGIAAAELTAAADGAADLFEYPGRLMPNPVFLEAADSMLLGRQLADIYRLLVSLPQRRFAGNRADYGRMLGLSEFQLEVVERAPTEPPPLLARADLYRTDTGFALLEMNIGSSLGGFQCAEINRAMASHPILAGFVAEQQLSWVDTAERLIGTALARHAERIGVPTTVALVDWPDTFSFHQPRIEVMARLCRRSGVETIVCHLGELTEGADGLSYRGRKVDVVYRFFLLEYVNSAGSVELLQPLLRAAERGAVTFLSPMDADIYGYKEGLALLSEMVHSDDLDDRERDTVAALVPWTRRLRTVVDDPAGETVDAVGFAVGRQSELMLKPISLHGGKGIVAGWTVEPDHWRRCLENALDGPYILQERVRPIPELVLANQAIGRMYCNWGVFLTPGPTADSSSYSGCLIRASADPEVDVIAFDTGALLGSCMTGP